MSTPYRPAHTAYYHHQSHDFDEQAELLRGWNQDYLQVSAGHFSGYISEAQCHDVHLFLEYTNQALFQRGQLTDDVIALGIPLLTQHTGMFCGATSHRDCVHIFSGRDGFEFFSPSELVMAGITVPRQALYDMLTPEEQASIVSICAQAHVFIPSANTLANLRQFMSSTFQTIQTTPSLLHNARFSLSIRAALLSLLTDSLSLSNTDTPIALSANHRWEIIAASRALALSQTDTTTSVADLCQHFGVSRRTLQYCFHDTLNVSPMQFLRTERLNAVRHTLKTASSVTEAAVEWGFWHFGHFSQEYKKLFGELPSHTFKRWHSLH